MMHAKLLWPKLPVATALLLLSGLSLAADHDFSTVGSITQNNGLTHNGHFEVKTPSILRIISSRALPANPREAIRQYDRLVELMPADDIRAEALRRSGDLRVQLSDISGDPDQSELHKAIGSYRRLLHELPDYERNDRVLYQLARAYQLAGDTDHAIDSLRALVTRYPHSVRMGDAAFRAAEWLYARGSYDQAEPQYRAVLSLGVGNALFKPAQYKYGWTLFKQGRYSQALPILLSILDRELPVGELSEPATALRMAADKSQYADGALHISCLAFAALGGGRAINDYFATSGNEPRYSVLLFRALGTLLVEKQRFSDAADTYSAFISRHPNHPLAPEFQTSVIAAFQQGGFDDLAVNAMESYAARYAPDSSYWNGRTPQPAVMAELRKDFNELGRHYHALAQNAAKNEPAGRRGDFIKAASWYQRALRFFPDAPEAADESLLCADALYDGGQTEAAAQQYAVTAYRYAGTAGASEAAFASVQAWQRLAHEVPDSAQAEVLKRSIDASLKLADTFPQHAQLSLVLTRAAGDLYAVKDYEHAISIAQRALQQPAHDSLHTEALGVVADSYFGKQQYPQAEAAYMELIKALPGLDPKLQIANEQLAASIYKQGEIARDAGDLRAAANAFQRVARAAPSASVRVNADYDAAAALMSMQDWKAAQIALENFRARYPLQQLTGDADKKLALAYQNDKQPAKAAEVYTRIAKRSSEPPVTRRDAAWLAAQLGDQAGAVDLAAPAYEFYLEHYPQPLQQAMTARRRLADFALSDRHDDLHYQHWLQEIINADAAAGGLRNDVSRSMAAQASLELGQSCAAKARALALSMPVNKSLPRRKAATEAAIASLYRAASYGYVDITTAATYEIGAVYRDFGRALLDSQRPSQLRGEALEQYNLLLEEQANPFEEKAISAHETNLQRLRQGLWNEWIRKSAVALAELAPAKYGKHDQRESIYESLH